MLAMLRPRTLCIPREYTTGEFGQNRLGAMGPQVRTYLIRLFVCSNRVPTALHVFVGNLKMLLFGFVPVGLHHRGLRAFFSEVESGHQSVIAQARRARYGVCIHTYSMGKPLTLVPFLRLTVVEIALGEADVGPVKLVF